MNETLFAHTADDTTVRTGLLQTGTCNLVAPLDDEETGVAPAAEATA